MYGTRGSIPIFNESSLRYGGNTTCVRIYNDNIPSHIALIIDAGSGFLAMGEEILRNEPNITEIVTLFTHWHHDHILGLFHSPVLFIEKYIMRLFGPKDNGIGPKEMMENMMCPPFFPVHINDVKGHFSYHDIEEAGRDVTLFHKKGITTISNTEFEQIKKMLNPVVELNCTSYPLKDFFVIKTMQTNHPGMTVSYRFEDMKTNKVFVLLTDHENQNELPQALEDHISNANLMVVDCQYPREKYDNHSIGYGHSTPDYVVELAKKTNIKQLGLTHHDPHSKDSDIDNLLNRAKEHALGSNINVFSCSDFMEIRI